MGKDTKITYYEICVGDNIKVQEPGQRFSHTAYKVLEITKTNFRLKIVDGSKADGQIIDMGIGLMRRCIILRYNE